MDKTSAVAALAALAHDTRLATFRLLVSSEPEGLPAGEVARLQNVPQNTMSSHLRILSQAGMVHSQRHSRSIVYRADLGRLGELMTFLVRDCCGGRAELCAPLLSTLAACR